MNLSTVESAKQKINDWLNSGFIAVGEKLPSERELETLLNVKRMTLRQALLNLEAESKIFRKDRKGWFAALPRFNYEPKSSLSFSLAATQQGRIPSWGYTNKTLLMKCPTHITSLLSIDENIEVYKVEGWGALENHKVFYHESYINSAYAPDFITSLDNNSFYQHWLNVYGVKTSLKQLIFKPIRLQSNACKALDIALGTAALMVEKQKTNEKGQIIQIDIEYWRLESVNFIVNLEES